MAMVSANFGNPNTDQPKGRVCTGLPSHTVKTPKTGNQLFQRIAVTLYRGQNDLLQANPHIHLGQRMSNAPFWLDVSDVYDAFK
jgi:hypothetical protein